MKRIAETQTGNTDTVAEKKCIRRKKRTMVMVICALAVAAAGCLILLEHSEIFDPSALFRGKESEGVTSMYSDRIISYNFYPSEYDVDVTQDAAYMAHNTYLQYRDGAETYTITDRNYAAYSRQVEFFGMYFDLVKQGDVESYNALFTEHYYDSNEPYELFAPQKIYDIVVSKVSENAATNRSAFDVSYKIYRNDGTFRNDIGSDAARTLCFELVEERGAIKIDAVTAYVYLQ